MWYKYGWKLKSQLYHPFFSCHKWIGLVWLFLFGFVTRHSMYFGWNVSSGLWFTIWLKANFSRSRVQEARDGFSFHALLTCSEILQESIWLTMEILHTSDPPLSGGGPFENFRSRHGPISWCTGYFLLHFYCYCVKKRNKKEEAGEKWEPFCIQRAEHPFCPCHVATMLCSVITARYYTGAVL